MPGNAGGVGPAPLDGEDEQVSQQTRRTLEDEPGDGRYRLDSEGRFVSVDGRITDLTGWSREELLGEHVSKVLDEEAISTAEATIRTALECDLETATLTVDVRRCDDGRVPCRVRLAPLFSNGEFDGTVGVVRASPAPDAGDDPTVDDGQDAGEDSNATNRPDGPVNPDHEVELQRRQRQQEVLADLGQLALETDDLDELMDEVARAVAETLATDYCEVLELDYETRTLALRQGAGWRADTVGSASVDADADSQAGYTLCTEAPIVVEDLDAESRFDPPELLTSHGVTSGVTVIIGSVDDPWGVLGAHDTDRRSFTDDDVNFVQSVANVLTTAIDRVERERQIRRQRERLEALNTLHGVVRRITEAVIEQPTREKVTETVCAYLADADSYQFAWMADADSSAQTVTPTSRAGTDGYLEDVEISIDPDDEHSGGPTGQAYLNGEIRTCQRVQSDPQYEPWQAEAETYGFRSSAAVPVVHENTVFGVLNVYSERPEAFEAEERKMLEHLGEIVGHVIAAVERKRALLGDELLEVEFRIRDVFDAYDVPETEGRIAFDRVVPVADEEYLVYGTLSPDAEATLEALGERISYWTAVTVRGDGDDERRFEVRACESPLVATVADIGGWVERAVVDNGDFNVTLRLPQGTDVRRVIDSVRDAYPNVELLARRQVERSVDASPQTSLTLPETLTDRQRTALSTAYHAGFFEWPRDSSGEDIADRLDISPATFTQHLRAAERKLFEALFEDQPTTG